MDQMKLPPDVWAMIDGLPQDIKDAIANLPPEFWEVAAQQPHYVNRRDGAALVSKHVFNVAPRSLEAWRVPWKRIRRQAQTPPAVLLAVAFQKRATAPISMGGGPAATAAA
jgi:hypothetical protein